MKKFKIRWRGRDDKIVHSAVVKGDDKDAHLLTSYVYRLDGGQVSRSAPSAMRRYNARVRISHDIMGKPPEHHLWYHRDGDRLNCCRDNYELIHMTEVARRARSHIK